MARLRRWIEKLLSHWEMGVVFLVGVLLISPYPHLVYDHFAASAPVKPPEVQPDQKEQLPPSSEESSHPLGGELWLLSEKLGEALIIAAVLGIVVDESVKKTLVKESVKNLLHLFIGYDLPDEVKAHLKYLLHLPFVRKGFTITYTFEKLDFKNANGIPVSCWEVTSETTYNIVNLTEKG